MTNGFLDLVVGGRFDDVPPDDQFANEEKNSAFTMKHYFIPFFRRQWPDFAGQTRRLLSLGCGTGADVDTLCDAGFDCIGIDNGNRTMVWPKRTRPDHFLLANGMHLPFEDGTFDGVFSGCVFPHVGVHGDTYKVTDRFKNDRYALAQEMARVLKPGGKILVSSPNRWFPFDIFHGRDAFQYLPRPYCFADPFLLSVSDYRKMFVEAGCNAVTAQPMSGYFGFERSASHLKGYLLGLPVKLAFGLVSLPGLNFLRGSPLTPWIVVLAEKS
jgi:SAM-dependent methyltransferase